MVATKVAQEENTKLVRWWLGHMAVDVRTAGHTDVADWLSRLATTWQDGVGGDDAHGPFNLYFYRTGPSDEFMLAVRLVNDGDGGDETLAWVQAQPPMTPGFFSDPNFVREQSKVRQEIAARLR